ncbi:MAG: winged helix-turn-helix domain-containing protein [Chroococcales cyanobacterium]
MNILLLGDDPSVDSEIFHLLKTENYQIDLATQKGNIWERLERRNYNLLILNIESFRFEAISLCRQLREVNYSFPILLMTVCQFESDVIKALEAGANDYVIKPFSPQEVLLRVRTLLHRHTQLPEILQWGGFSIKTGSCEVTYNGNLVTLTPKEYQLLELFIQHKNRVFSCRNILEKLWSIENEPLEDTVRAHIKGLRQKLKLAGAADDVIETVYGLGYRLKVESNTCQKTSISKTSEGILSQKLWGDFKQSILAQGRILEKASLAFTKREFNPFLRDRALSEARTLVILLNTFGLVECCQIAREIETLLHRMNPLNPEESAELSQLVTLLFKKLQTIKIDASLLLTIPKELTQKRSPSLHTIEALTESESSPLALQMLNSYLQLGQQNQKPVSLVLFRYSSQYYPFSEEAIADLEDKIRLTFRSSDIITRWKPWEVIVGMYGAHRENARKRVKQVLALFYSPRFPEQFPATLSFGIAQSPDDGLNLNTLYSKASTNINEKDLILNQTY